MNRDIEEDYCIGLYDQIWNSLTEGHFTASPLPMDLNPQFDRKV